MKGILSYIAIMGFATVWIVGWMCLAWLVGAFFNLSMATTSVVGATLGPLGVIAVLVVGFSTRNSPHAGISNRSYRTNNSSSSADPFL
jgi:hypothetical protein